MLNHLGNPESRSACQGIKRICGIRGPMAGSVYTQPSRESGIQICLPGDLENLWDPRPDGRECPHSTI